MERGPFEGQDQFVEFLGFVEFVGEKPVRSSGFGGRWSVEFMEFMEFVGRSQFGVGHAYRESHRCSACHALSGSNGPSIARMILSAR